MWSKRSLLGLVSFLSAIHFATAATIRVGMAIPSYAHGILWIAKDAGFFEKNGLDAQIFVLHGSADAMRLLATGKVDIVLAGGDSLVKADLAGADFVAFAGVVNQFFHRIVTRDDIRDPGQLKGKVIGLPFLGGPQDMAVQTALARWGLRYGKDVTVRNMGAESARLLALKRGVVDAVPSDAAVSVIQKLGLHVLGDVPSWNVRFPYMMAVSRRDYLKKNASETNAFLKALIEAMDYYKAHAKESIVILSKNIAEEKGTEIDTAELYRQNGPSIFTYPPYPDPKGFETVLLYVRSADGKPVKAKPEDFIVRDYLDRIKPDKMGIK